MRYWVEQTNRRIDQKYPKSDQIHVNTNLVLTNNFYDVIIISNKKPNYMDIYSWFNVFIDLYLIMYQLFMYYSLISYVATLNQGGVA